MKPVEGTPSPQRRAANQNAPLSNWPRYPGGAVAGALVAIAFVLMFFFNSPGLRYSLGAVGALVVALWAVHKSRSGD